MPDSHTVSCEPCKRKKCKCDRKLPCCTQCSTLPSFCKYYENNKRGIPTGYLNSLEQRLNEAENALYNAFAQLRELRSRSDYEENFQEVLSISARPANETKASRMEEWKRFPLKEPSDLETWWSGVVGDGSFARSPGHHSITSRVIGQDLDVRPDTSSGFELGNDSMTRSREETLTSVELANRRPESRAQNTPAWNSREDNTRDFASTPLQQGLERPSMRETPSAGTLTRNSSLPTGEGLVKSTQLVREMNHVYY